MAVYSVIPGDECDGFGADLSHQKQTIACVSRAAEPLGALFQSAPLTRHHRRLSFHSSNRHRTRARRFLPARAFFTPWPRLLSSLSWSFSSSPSRHGHARARFASWGRSMAARGTLDASLRLSPAFAGVPQSAFGSYVWPPPVTTSGRLTATTKCCWDWTTHMNNRPGDIFPLE